MYSDPQQHYLHQQQQQQPPPIGGGGGFPRGPPPPQMMRQDSVSSNNFTPQDYPHHHHHQQLPPPQQQQQQHHHPPVPPPPAPYDGYGDGFGGKRMRKLTQRRAVDYTSTVVRYTQVRMWQHNLKDRTTLQPTPAAAVDMLPPVAYSDNPSVSFTAKFVHTSLNKNRCSINQVLNVVSTVIGTGLMQSHSAEIFVDVEWTPNGRRLITGSQSGEFTLWNGQSFNFEMILQAHDQAIRSMIWSHNDNWMVSGDDGGSIKYWQSNMNNVKANKSAHKESVRGLSFCRNDLKFCSCSDDTTVKVWDFARCQEERSLTGHGWDVKSVDWHPTKSLLVSGGKDNLVKLWDAKSGRELCSFHGHKNTVLCVKWNQNGNWVLTASKDQIIKLYDIRAMKELESFRGHRKDVTALAWHPFHEEYFVSGSFDGSILHWLVGHENPQIEVFSAHDNSVWDLAWHPVGYLLCSGSNDHTTKFWCRNRPGDTARDKFHMGQNQGYGEQHPAYGGRLSGNYPVPDSPATPGPFAPGLTRNEGTIPGVGAAMPLTVPSLEASQVDLKQPLPMSGSLGAPPLPPGPHPSLLATNPQQIYQQNLQQMSQQQHHGLPQQMSNLPVPPNMQQLQPPSHLPLLQHPHLPRPPPQMPPHGMTSTMPGSLQTPMPIPGSMGVQGTMNQMVPPLPQGHFRGMNPVQSGSLATSAAPPAGGFPNGLPNVSGSQMYQQGAPFNRSPGGQLPLMPGFNPFQSGNQSVMPPPLPPGPPPPSQ